MCGIVGIINKNGTAPIESQTISGMCDVMSHRGPDDYGIFVNEHVGLGHRRLSIIDLATGHQPMFTPDQRYVIVFNGEIYNYKDLRAKLISLGSDFQTNSDTEVILELYRQYGKECVKHLNGIFAFCIYDTLTNETFLARDHIGIKPLYYFDDNRHFIFASEIKSILKSDLAKAECDLAKLPEYFIYRQVAGHDTLFKNIHSLAPGSYMLLRNGKTEISRYWDVTRTVINEHINHQDAFAQLSDLLTDSIKMQLMSDVPLGTFCSGGVDSSLVTAIAAMNTGKKINTFSVGFDEKEYDESKYAKMVAARYDTNHHELRLNNQEFADLFEKTVWHNDLPLNFANSVLIYALSALAKQTVTVVLTGEGADELFGGYPRYMIPVIHSKLKKIPEPLLRIAKYGLGLMPDHRAKKLASYISASDKDVLLYNSAVHTPEKLAQYGININDDTQKYRTSLITGIAGKHHALSRVSLLDQQTYLQSILNRQDKMSMAASIESRVPILDYRLIEFSNSLPASIKCDRLKPKLILKQLAEEYLPRELIYRQKSGFGVPLSDWFADKQGLGDLADGLLTESCLEELEFRGNIRNILSEHKAKIHDHSEFLWSAINYVQWKSIFKVSV